MIELVSNQLVFRFPEIHPECSLTVTLHRTLRIPDDGREYPLPPSLGHFPMVHVDDHSSRAPKKWLGRGGIAIPMWQSEAMWIQFNPSQVIGRASPWPFAVRVACGKVSAVTGKVWSKKLLVDDYVVCPLQPWLDGFVTDEGQIKQFVAAPLGLGATVEGQVTKKEEFGGLQIEVIPMNLSEYDKRYPYAPPFQTHRSILRGVGSSNTLYGSTTITNSLSGNIGSLGTHIYANNSIGTCTTTGSTGVLGSKGPTSDYWEGGSSLCSNDLSVRSINTCMLSAVDNMTLKDPEVALDMGMGMGGRMKQQIFKDPYGLKTWSKKHTSRVFIHMCNSLGWRYLTGLEPSTVPLTASDYTARGFAWFHYYEENASSLKGTETLKKVKSVAEYSKKKKIPILPENQPAHVTIGQTLMIQSKNLGKVRSGSWAK